MCTYDDAPQARVQFTKHFPDHFQILRLFQDFQASGHPELKSNILRLSVFDVRHDPLPSAAAKVSPMMMLMMMMGVRGAGIIDHVSRHCRLVNVDKSCCRNLTVNLHHCYAADRRLHSFCGTDTPAFSLVDNDVN